MKNDLRGKMMKSKEYNDIGVILENMDKNESDLIPEKYKEFVTQCMDPDYTSEIDPTLPLELQTLSEGTKDQLAVLMLTYWAKTPWDRRALAEELNRNEKIYRGEDPEEHMTDEEYQKFLETFDFMDETFGPIPYWAQSRNWQPWVCFGIVPDEEAEFFAGNTGLKEVHVDRAVRERIREEACEWVLHADIKEEETLYWHDNDHSEWSSTKDIEDFYKKYAVVRDGHFHGAVIETEMTSSMGLSVYKNREWGILLTDGSRDGRTSEHYSHSSDEVSESKDTTYTLKRKE